MVVVWIAMSAAVFEGVTFDSGSGRCIIGARPICGSPITRTNFYAVYGDTNETAYCRQGQRRVQRCCICACIELRNGRDVELPILSVGRIRIFTNANIYWIVVGASRCSNFTNLALNRFCVSTAAPINIAIARAFARATLGHRIRNAPEEKQNPEDTCHGVLAVIA
jgi:hypothetical protein